METSSVTRERRKPSILSPAWPSDRAESLVEQESAAPLDTARLWEMAENAAESLSRGARVIVTGRLEQRSWETPDGDKRSKVEVVADEIGPSIRWATAQVTKNERRGPGDGGPQGGGAQSGGAQSGGRSGSPTGGSPGPSGDAQGYGYSEEPF